MSVRAGARAGGCTSQKVYYNTSPQINIKLVTKIGEEEEEEKTPYNSFADHKRDK